MTMKNRKIYNLDMKVLSGIILSLFVSVSFAQHPADTLSHKEKMVVGDAKRQITGTVFDASTGEPLAGIRIQAYNKAQYAAMTGENGSFKINVPDYVTSLTAQADGYGLILCPIDVKTNTATVRLYSDEFNPSYDQQIKATKEKSTGIESLNADVSVDRQIQANLGGDVRSIMRSGQKGMGAMFLMNGVNSLIANAQPLIVLDGVMMDMQYNRSAIHDGFYNNILSNISVNDIEKVTVVKNGMALYGAKGANGVLLIDTKRNKSMATKIDVDITGDFEQVPNLPSMMDATDYRYYASELLGSTGTKLTEFKFLKSDPDYYYYKQYHNNTDWSKEVYQEAFSRSYGINVQGGDDIASYNLSVGYSNANSTLKKSDMTRFNLRLNSDINLSKNLNVRFDASYSDINRNLRDDGVADDFENTTITSVGLLGLIKAPFLSPYQYDINGNLSSYLSDADDYLDELLGTDVSIANPSALLYYGEGKNKNNFGNRMINLSVSPVYKINRDFTMTEHFSYTLINTNAMYYTPIKGMPSLIIENVGTVDNVAKSMSSRNNLFSSETRLDWTKAVQSYTFHASGGFRFYQDNYELNSLQGYNTGNDKTPNLSTSLSYKSTSGTDDKSMSLTYYALGDLSYQGKYFLSGGVSSEASSRFGKDVESGVKMFGVAWGLFPSIAGSWVLTSEPWLRPNWMLNFLKVNVGYDISGNDDLDCTASRTYFGGTRLLNQIGGLVLENIGNTTLQWETTKRLTAGADANLLDNRLTLSFNYFKSKTEDILSLRKLSYLSGIEHMWSNDGELSNNGYDLSLKCKLFNLKALKMEVGASVAHYDNKITALPGGEESFTTEMYGATVLSKVGSPVGLFYGYKTDGVYSTTEEAQNDGKYIVLKNGEKEYFGAGDMVFVSTNDEEVNEDDQTVIGDPNPDFYGNIFANIKCKNISLNVVFNYSVGNDIFNYERMILEAGSAFYNQTTAMNNRWTTEGQVTDIPVITYGDPMGNSRFSDRWIEDGSYLRLKTVTLSYNLPIHSTYLQGVTIWGSANNLWTWTKYLGSDPESSASNDVLLQGIDRGLLSQGRTFSFGVKINI
jgi:TonB-linked SusC/RagA family outer membrane protein